MRRTPLKPSLKRLKRTSSFARKKPLKRAAKKRKRREKTPLEKAHDKLWRLLSQYIRDRDNWTCVTCGKRETGRSMHGGHYVPGSNKATKYDPHNVHAQCVRCNFHEHSNATEYSLFIVEKYGQEEHARIVKDGRGLKQWKLEELLTLIETLQTDPSQYETEYYKLHG